MTHDVTTVKEILDTTSDYERLIKKASQIQQKCQDHKVLAHDIRLDDDLNLTFADQSIKMSDLATSHLCGKLGVPSRYYNKLVEDGFTELARDNINTWTAAQWLAMRQNQKKWVEAQMMACVFIAMHRSEGWGFKRLSELGSHMADIKADCRYRVDVLKQLAYDQADFEWVEGGNNATV